VLQFCTVSSNFGTHHGALQICLHSFRVDSLSCTSIHEVQNHSNCDDSTAQRRRILQKHRASIFLHCDSPEHCAWRASTSAHKRLLVARPGAAGRYFFICSMLVLQWDPATCAASLSCAGNALPVHAYFRYGGVRSAHIRQILPTCAQVFPLHCPVRALQWSCVTTVRAWRCARFRLHHKRKLHVTHSDRERLRDSVGVFVLVCVCESVRESQNKSVCASLRDVIEGLALWWL